jgi:RNA 2',3'-cyclic 3'-phosphodiesterase
LRAFLGIPVPAYGCDLLCRETKNLRDRYPQLKWVEPANYHITVQFLGDLNDREIRRVCGALDSFPQLSSVDVAAVRMASFPRKGPPKVIVAGLGSGSELCVQVRELFVHRVPEYREGRDYVPHVTLARVPRRGPSPRVELPLPDLSVSFAASNLVLFESVLRPQGPIYRHVHSLAFR